MEKEKITAKHLRVAVMSYFRFKRNCVAAHEVFDGHQGISDVLVSNGKEIFDIEIKVNKRDLTVAELKKKKHERFKVISHYVPCPMVNKFLICVPPNLIATAEEFVKDTNDKYGILEFKEEEYHKMKASKGRIVWESLIRYHKPGKKFHKKYHEKIETIMFKRLSSASCLFLEKEMEK